MAENLQWKMSIRGWTVITKEQAIKHINNAYASIRTMKHKDIENYINTEKLRGARVRDLINLKDW